MNDLTMKQAASLADEGKSLYSSKKYLQAADSFGKSAVLYHEGGAPALAAEMRNNQSVALLMEGKPHRALEALEGTSEVFKVAGENIKQGMALANQAAALKEMGEKEQAIHYYSLAGKIFRDAGAEEMYLQTSQSVSSLKLQSRDLVGALFSMQAGLDGLEKPTWRQKLLKSLLKIPNQLLDR